LRLIILRRGGPIKRSPSARTLGPNRTALRTDRDRGAAKLETLVGGRLSASEWADLDRQNPIVCENSADRLSGPPLVVVEDSAKPFMTHNGRIHVDHALTVLNQPIVESLMVSLDVVVICVFLHYAA